ncbi:flagellin [Anaerobiospirillum sp. NML120448]|uniref:flagellin N-terminal helical domain-containing protein n=1 Tax=Anaerobiospirillum sp. NML120448 TaxID=2932816 RepID=UPI001FF1B752|nr:flagellin [Anaerobiospirillum sp. NML120448]MCK0515477.1 flagellin [Anaerobiospirillum sp. NML120448]
MAIYITNIAAMQARRHFNNATARVNTAMQRLASGLRINSAKDDPAGLQISNRLTSQINGYKQANRNTADGQAFAQTYEGALDETVNMLQKIRTIAVQSANGTYTSEDRKAMQAEVKALSEEITRIAEQTKFGGKTILLGDQSTMLDKGFMTLQVGAYSDDTISIDLTQSFKLDDIYAALPNNNGSVVNGSFTVDTADGAKNVLADIDAMIGIVDAQRGEIGALQVRLDSVMRLNENMTANLSDARSRIRDTDYAEESANLMEASILQQASLAMMMQANARGNMILQLINGARI